MQVIETTENNYSQIDRVKEFKKCALSPSYFATHYCYTLNVEKNTIALFPEYEYCL